MKKFPLFIFLFLFSYLLKAQESSITVFAKDGEKFWLILDGEKQNVNPQVKVKINNLTNPNYKLKVIFQDSKIKTIDQNVMTEGVEPGPMDVVYSVQKNPKGKYVMRVNSFKPALAAKPIENNNTQTTQTIPASTSTTTTTQVPVQIQVIDHSQIIDPNQNVVITNSLPGISMTTTIQTPSQVVTQMPVQTSQTTQTTTQTNQNVQNPSILNQNAQTTTNVSNSNIANPCIVAANSNLFSSFKTSLEKQSFEESKLKMVDQFIKSNCLNSSQVKSLMNQFNFEASRLSVAKKAYINTVDKGNYFIVNDEFDFSTSVDELTEYIGSFE